MQITIIGIYDKKPEFSAEQQKAIAETRLFAGGKRHYELIKRWLPENACWVDITVPLSNFFDKVKKSGENWLVFASGDPLFFGIGNTLKRELPDANFVFYPVFNSLQLLAHRFGINYGEFKTVSLTGRDWHAFDKALLHGEKRLAILTDRKNTPATIAQRMLEFGYNNYRMFYGQCLGGENERIVELSLQGAATFPFSHPNCFFLEMTEDRIPRKGIPETDFEILEGRPKMITKMAIRMLTLAALQLHNKKLFWDVGACTGSVSIEARLHFPDVKVVAFEKRKESLEIIKKNARKFQTPGIQLFIGDYAEMDKANQEQPDAVFLGGYGGKMEVILNDVNAHLLHGGIIVFNSVSEQSENSFLCWARKNNYQLQIQQKLAVDEHNPISILAIKKQ
ncbi:precorrin-6Y C5,15-methyltransferase (decarboxylating) [Draconibacterium orientale]|uniref:Cytochrome D ubiquinol oxidase subunit II n=1 Tax=Draconibacterium orientale TaxID=1168034 RepID=X5DC63_9BACT|nr:precorrin-6y C5,15-methyltransferase (decarboxylating) subunit CbiE [Draconibacterium orientale]AHW58549.1 cytochrome D ubiquinol oxidase subunit II [Draconibacterium orientale]SET89303.1 precorrin-6Y C5,15-methyltransferase (decarboxylating) [Draconibacterium orientale]